MNTYQSVGLFLIFLALFGSSGLASNASNPIEEFNTWRFRKFLLKEDRTIFDFDIPVIEASYHISSYQVRNALWQSGYRKEYFRDEFTSFSYYINNPENVIPWEPLPPPDGVILSGNIVENVTNNGFSVEEWGNISISVIGNIVEDTK